VSEHRQADTRSRIAARHRLAGSRSRVENKRP
jgi:hypothetical protein